MRANPHQGRRERKYTCYKARALGDFIQAAASFAAIRIHHHRSRITLLTTAPFAEFAVKSPWFDNVWVDHRPKSYDLAGWLGLRSRLRRGRFTRVYDLQTSRRTARYFRLFWPGPPPDWSGIARGCTLPHDNPTRDFMHTVERQAEQLAMAGLRAHLPQTFHGFEAIYRALIFKSVCNSGARWRTA